MSERIVVIVNKWYECDPFLAALLNQNARPPGFPVAWRKRLRHPRLRTNTPSKGGKASFNPRAKLPLGSGRLEVWCLSDLLEHLPDTSAEQSNPKRKAKRLRFIFRGAKPKLVIAVGTAGYAVGPSLPCAEPANGHVLVGSSVFMHDFHPERTGEADHWDCPDYDRVLTSALPPALFDGLVAPLRGLESDVAKRFAQPPLSPAAAPHVMARHDLVSVGSLNVTDPKEYVEADRRAFDAHVAAGGDVSLPRSIETTHGLIRAHSSAPFLFVSGIANRALAAQEELLPRKFAQETTAATNAGIALAWMLPRLDLYLRRSLQKSEPGDKPS